MPVAIDVDKLTSDEAMDLIVRLNDRLNIHMDDSDEDEDDGLTLDDVKAEFVIRNALMNVVNKDGDITEPMSVFADFAYEAWLSLVEDSDESFDAQWGKFISVIYVTFLAVEQDTKGIDDVDDIRNKAFDVIDTHYRAFSRIVNEEDSNG